MNPRLYRETTEKYGDAPATATEALAHVLAVFADESDAWMVVNATNGAYGDGVITGLTLGDLRELAALVDAKPAHHGPGRPASELPDWAVSELSDRGIDPGEVTHFIGDPNGRTIAAAVDGKPVHLARP